MAKNQRGNRQWENRRTGYGTQRVLRKRMKELNKKRREKLENQQAADENLPENLAEVEGDAQWGTIMTFKNKKVFSKLRKKGIFIKFGS